MHHKKYLKKLGKPAVVIISFIQYKATYNDYHRAYGLEGALPLPWKPQDARGRLTAICSSDIWQNRIANAFQEVAQNAFVKNGMGEKLKTSRSGTSLQSNYGEQLLRIWNAQLRNLSRQITQWEKFRRPADHTDDKEVVNQSKIRTRSSVLCIYKNILNCPVYAR